MAQLPWNKLVRPLAPAGAMVKGQGPAAPDKLLKQMAALMLAQAQKAFLDQKLEGHWWPPRYPSQSGGKLNVAGAVEDLNHGPNIKERRFVDRPALLDRGILRKSLAPRMGHVKMIGMWSVEVGTTVPYAGIHQWGGVTVKPLTYVFQRNLFLWLRSNRKKADNKRKKGMNGEALKIEGQVAIVQSRLGPLVKMKALITRVNPRPFLGWTKTLGQKVVELMKRNLKGI